MSAPIDIETPVQEETPISNIRLECDIDGVSLSLKVRQGDPESIDDNDNRDDSEDNGPPTEQSKPKKRTTKSKPCSHKVPHKHTHFELDAKDRHWMRFFGKTRGQSRKQARHGLINFPVLPARKTRSSAPTCR